MKKSIIIAVITLVMCRGLLADVQARTNGVELLFSCRCIDTVSSTPTNVAITFKLEGFSMIWRDGKTLKTADYMKNNEAFILTPDQEVAIGAYGGGVTLTAISFKDGKKGFRVMRCSNHIYDNGSIRCEFAYLALGDTLTPMGMDDVEMIWDSKINNTGLPIGWKHFEGDQAIIYVIPPKTPTPVVPSPAQETPPEPQAVTPPEPAVAQTPVTEDEPPAATAGDEPNQAESKASNRWLYALIPLGLLPILYVLRKKRK